MAEQKEERQPPGQEENGEDPYAGSTDENTDHEGPPESPDLPIPELPGGNPSLLMWGLPCHLSKVTCPRPPPGWPLPTLTCLPGSSPSSLTFATSVSSQACSLPVSILACLSRPDFHCDHLPHSPAPCQTPFSFSPPDDRGLPLPRLQDQPGGFKNLQVPQLYPRVQLCRWGWGSGNTAVPISIGTRLAIHHPRHGGRRRSLFWSRMKGEGLPGWSNG